MLLVTLLLLTLLLFDLTYPSIMLMFARDLEDHWSHLMVQSMLYEVEYNMNICVLILLSSMIDSHRKYGHVSYWVMNEGVSV